MCKSVVLLWLTLLLSPAIAAEMAGKELTCYSTVFPPYVIDEPSGLSGIDVDVVAQAGKRAGLSIRFAVLPWIRLESEIRRGAASPIDCAFAYTRNDKRVEYMDFSRVPLKTTRYLLFVKAGTVASSSDLSWLKGKRIGLRHGFVVPGVFDEMRKRRELVVDEVSDDVTNFRKLALGRIDAIVANADAGLEAMRSVKSNGIVALEPAVSENPTFLVLNKGKNLAPLLDGLDKALGEMDADGSMSRIRDKYLKP